MISFKNYISNLNFNHLLFGFIIIFFFYIKNLINKFINLQQLNILILNKLCCKINYFSKKNNKNYNKFKKKFKKNYKKIKKIYKKSNSIYLKHLLNNESNKIKEVIQTPIINNLESDKINQSNCITVDEENEFEILD